MSQGEICHLLNELTTLSSQSYSATAVCAEGVRIPDPHSTVTGIAMIHL